MVQEFEIVVIGLGAVGAAALYQLTSRNAKVLGIDKYNPPHAMGSSHGDTRITRQAIGEGAQFTPLALRSYEIFEELEKASGRNLLCKTGGLMIAGAASTGVHGVANFFENTLDVARNFNIRHEHFGSKDIRERFPQFNVQENEQAYFEYDAGYLLAEQCIQTQLEMACARGATIRPNETVRSIEESSEGKIVVTTDNGQIRCAKVVVSAGPWVSDFIPDELQKLFTVERQIQHWFDVEANYQDFAPEKFPIFIWETSLGGHSYGFPAIDGPTGGFKIGSSLFNKVTSPSTIERQVGQEEIDSMFESQVRNFFPLAKRKSVRTAVCMYTATADGGFIIDKLPGYSSVLLCSPCSGHGFKHSAAIGQCIAEKLLVGESSIDISSFALPK